MPVDIDPQTMPVDDLPGIWSPVQWELSEEERIEELELQATASLLWAVDAPEAILRLLLDETKIDRLFDPPDGYDEEHQGEWDPDLVTFAFNRSIKLENIERQEDYLRVTYKVSDLGTWVLEIQPAEVHIYRL